MLVQVTLTGKDFSVSFEGDRNAYTAAVQRLADAVAVNYLSEKRIAALARWHAKLEEPIALKVIRQKKRRFAMKA